MQIFERKVKGKWPESRDFNGEVKNRYFNKINEIHSTHQSKDEEVN